MAVRETPRFGVDTALRIHALDPDGAAAIAEHMHDLPVDRFVGSMVLGEHASEWNKLVDSFRPNDARDLAGFAPASIKDCRVTQFHLLNRAQRVLLARNMQRAWLSARPTGPSLVEVTACRIMGRVVMDAVRKGQEVVSDCRAVAWALHSPAHFNGARSVRKASELALHLQVAMSVGQCTPGRPELPPVLRISAAEHHVQPMMDPGDLARSMMASINGLRNRLERTPVVGPMAHSAISGLQSSRSLERLMAQRRSVDAFRRLAWERKHEFKTPAMKRAWDDVAYSHARGRLASTLGLPWRRRARAAERAEDDTSVSYTAAERAHRMSRRAHEDEKLASDIVSAVAEFSANTTVFVTSQGREWTLSANCAYHNTGERLYVLSLDDLREVALLSDEATATVTAFAAERDVVSAGRISMALRTAWWCQHASSAYEANMVPVIHRDADGLSKAACAGAIPDVPGVGYIVQETAKVRQERGALSFAVLALCERACGTMGLADFASVRALRTLAAHRFSIPAIESEHRYCYTLQPEVSDDKVEHLTACTGMVLAKMHCKRWGEWPKSLIRHWRANDKPAHRLAQAHKHNDIPMESFLSWVPDADGVWDWGAARTKDKTNIVPDVSLHLSPEVMARQTSAQRREVLYYAARDWRAEAKRYYADLCSGRPVVRPTVLTVKPEPKEFGRVITMESCDKRRFNSLLNNNLAPLVTSWPGNLIGTSGVQKAQAHTSIAARKTRHDSGIVYSVLTDFKKFGHYISNKVQTSLCSLLSKYFGMPGLAVFATQLFSEVFIMHYAGFHATFENKVGSDGQGMRNMLWQLMLAAMPHAVLEDLPALIKGASVNEPLHITWYSDDHHFEIVFHGHRASLTLAKMCRHHRRAHSGLAVAYGRYGLVLEPTKGITSLDGYALLGDVHNNDGLVRITGKGASGALGEPRARAPSLADDIAASTAAASSMVISGAKPHEAWAVSAHCAATLVLRAHETGSQINMTALAVGMCAPLAMGGLGFPFVQSLISGLQPRREEDGLYALFFNASSSTRYKHYAAARLSRQPDKRGRQSATSRLTLKERVPVYESALLPVVTKAFPGKDGSMLQKMVDHRRAVVRAVEASVEVIPFTVVAAVANAHPASILEASIAQLLESASASALVGSVAIRHARSVNRRRAREWILDCERVRSVGDWTDSTWAECVARCEARAGRTSGPPIMASRFALVRLPDQESAAEDTVHVVVKRQANPLHGRYLAYSTPNSGYADTSGLWLDPARAALASAINLAISELASAGAAVRTVRRCLEKSWHGVELGLLGTYSSDVVPFRDVTDIAFVGGANASGLSRFTSHVGIDARTLEIDAAAMNRHTNHGAIQAYLTLQESAGCLEPGLWSIADTLLWETPRWGDATAEVGPEAKVEALLTDMGEQLRDFRDIMMNRSAARPLGPRDEERKRNIAAGGKRAYEEKSELMREIAIQMAPILVAQDAAEGKRARVAQPDLRKTDVHYHHLVGDSEAMGAAPIIRQAMDAIALRVMVRICANGVRASGIILSFGTNLDAGRFAEISRDAEYALLMPTRDESRAFEAIVDEFRLASQAYDLLSRIWSEHTRGASVDRQAAPTVSSLFLHMARRVPSWWLSYLRRQIATVPAGRMAENGAFTDLYNILASRYEYRANLYLKLLLDAKKAGISLSRNAVVPPEVQLCRSAFMQHHLLHCVYRVLGRAVAAIDQKGEQASEHSADLLAAADDAARSWVGRFMYKRKARVTRPAVRFLFALKLACGSRINSQIWESFESATSRWESLRQVVCNDLGLRVDHMDWTTEPVDAELSAALRLTPTKSMQDAVWKDTEEVPWGRVAAVVSAKHFACAVMRTIRPHRADGVTRVLLGPGGNKGRSTSVRPNTQALLALGTATKSAARATRRDRLASVSRDRSASSSDDDWRSHSRGGAKVGAPARMQLGVQQTAQITRATHLVQPAAGREVLGYHSETVVTLPVGIAGQTSREAALPTRAMLLETLTPVYAQGETKPQRMEGKAEMGPLAELDAPPEAAREVPTTTAALAVEFAVEGSTPSPVRAEETKPEAKAVAVVSTGPPAVAAPRAVTRARKVTRVVVQTAEDKLTALGLE